MFVYQPSKGWQIPLSPRRFSKMSETLENGTVVNEIAGHEVALALKFQPGHTLTENQTKVLNAAYFRQFTNNMNANQKSRVEATPPKAPLTVEDIQKVWVDYEPNVGGGPRQTSMEKIREDAAWRMWSGKIAAHNKSVAAGGAPVIQKAGTNQIPALKMKALADGTKVTVVQQRDSLIARLLTMDEYASDIQDMVDVILAEKGKGKAETAAPENTVAMDDLF